MIIIHEDTGSEAYYELLKKLYGDGYKSAKFKELNNVTIQIEDITRGIPLSKKIFWAWAFIEALERVSPNYVNPGIAWKLRPSWKNKLEKEEGKFCYTYNEIIQPQLKTILSMIRKTFQREAILSVYQPDHLNQSLAKNGLRHRTPCTIAIHFYRRPYTNIVDMMVMMRSSDVPNMLSFDLFQHCFLGQYVCAKTGTKPGAAYFHFSHSYMHQRRATPVKLEKELAAIKSRNYKGNFELSPENLDFAIDCALQNIDLALNGEPPSQRLNTGNPYIDELANAVLYKITNKSCFESNHSFSEIV